MVFNRILGIPNEDKISSKKYKIKIFQYILLVLSFVVVCYFVIHRNVTNRVVSITADYKDRINAPNFILLFDKADVLLFFLGGFSINRFYYDKKGNYVVDSLVDCTATNAIDYLLGTLSCNYLVNSTYVLFDTDYVAYVSNDDFSLGQRESLEISVLAGYFDNGVPSIPITVFFGGETYYSDTTQQFTIGTSKKIVDNFGDEKEVFISSVATSNSKRITQQNSTVFQISYSIYFNDNAVITEKSESNFELSIRILSDIGSYVTLLIGIVSLFCSRIITRLFIRDKSGWFDTDTHGCIVYHYDQIKSKQFEMYKMDVEKIYPNNAIKDANIGINDSKNQK
ncbi:hypothetical protein ACTA71_000474 [Dictyostelium dimigraforme]